MSPVILFSNPDQTTLILDVPGSVEYANGGGKIVSSRPIQQPFVTPEPKGSKRDVFVSELPATHIEYHEGIEYVLERSLRVLTSANVTQWCLPRAINKAAEDPGLKPADDANGTNSQLPIALSLMSNNFGLPNEVQNALIHNDQMGQTSIVFDDVMTMFVPSHCTFLWGSMQRGLTVMQMVRPDSVSTLDLILMDPPWMNRSVRKTRKYRMIDQQHRDPFEEALAFVDYLRAPDGYLAIWTTNKAAVREQVLASMAVRGFGLAEEWIWLKVTENGEPVTPITGVWRKPYEVLMIFKHGVPMAAPVRRSIMAVPDLHSRKPNLKTLFLEILDCRHVLELFARNLTSGWWSIGDEVLKFQDSRQWHTPPCQGFVCTAA